MSVASLRTIYHVMSWMQTRSRDRYNEVSENFMILQVHNINLTPVNLFMVLAHETIQHFMVPRDVSLDKVSYLELTLSYLPLCLFDSDYKCHGQFEQNNESVAPVPVAMSARGYRTSDISNEENLNSCLLENVSLGRFAFASASDQYGDLCSTPEVLSGNSNAVGSGHILGKQISLRTRQPRNQPSAKCLELQGYAPRRIRLQQQHKAGPFDGSKWRDLSYKEENDEAKSIAAKAEGTEEKHTAAVAASAVIIDDSWDLFVPGSSNITRRVYEQGSVTKSITVFPRGSEKEVPSASLETPPALYSFPSSMHLLRVLVVVGLSIVFVGLWRCL